MSYDDWKTRSDLDELCNYEGGESAWHCDVCGRRTDDLVTVCEDEECANTAAASQIEDEIARAYEEARMHLRYARDGREPVEVAVEHVARKREQASALRFERTEIIARKVA